MLPLSLFFSLFIVFLFFLWYLWFHNLKSISLLLQLLILIFILPSHLSLLQTESSYIHISFCHHTFKITSCLTYGIVFLSKLLTYELSCFGRCYVHFLLFLVTSICNFYFVDGHHLIEAVESHLLSLLLTNIYSILFTMYQIIEFLHLLVRL